MFLEAEKLNYSGEDWGTKVIPAYRQVVTQYPKSWHASKALFVVAFLHESLRNRQPPVLGSLDSAKVAYKELAAKYSSTLYGSIAADKLAAAGVAIEAQVEKAVIKPNYDTALANKVMAEDQKDNAVPDTSSGPAKKHQEVMESNYDDVDQY